MINIELIPGEIKVIAIKWARIISKVQTDFEGAGVQALAAYLPNGMEILTGMEDVFSIAISNLNVLATAAGSPKAEQIAVAVESRLQKLGADLTQIEHADEKHTALFYFRCVLVVIEDLAG